MTSKQIIREAEEKIEDVLQELQDTHGIRPYRVQVLEPGADTVEVTIIKDERYS
jgi:hypothetical protein